MNLHNSIGGYFELELAKNDHFLHSNSILLNSARNCFEYVLRANKITHVYMPKYTCDVMFEPLDKLGVSYTLYSINKELEINEPIDLLPNDYIVYTNYFGVKDDYSRQLGKLYGPRLILDCSQALFFEPLSEGCTIYSPRKFVGLSDGGCLYTDKLLSDKFEYDNSYQRFSHLIKRIDLGAEAAYDDFNHNDRSLVGQPIKHMSRLTRRLMGTIKYDEIVQCRKDNFVYLRDRLGITTSLAGGDVSRIACPMYYPYMTTDLGLRQKLIDNKIFTPTYWPNILNDYSENDIEYQIAKQLILLPIDQRYNHMDMDKIVRIINER